MGPNGGRWRVKACPDLLWHFLSTSKFFVLGAPFKLFEIGAVNGGKHKKGGVPKKGIYNQNPGPLSNNFKLERLLVTAASSM